MGSQSVRRKEQEKQQRRHAQERERTRVFGLSDYANEAAGDVVEWSFDVGNKGAHFPARGLHVLMRDFIMFCADDDEDPVLLEARLAAYSTARDDEEARSFRVCFVRVRCD